MIGTSCTDDVIIEEHVKSSIFTRGDIKESGEIVDTISTRGHCEYSCGAIITKNMIGGNERDFI